MTKNSVRRSGRFLWKNVQPWSSPPNKVNDEDRFVVATTTTETTRSLARSSGGWSSASGGGKSGYSSGGKSGGSSGSGYNSNVKSTNRADYKRAQSVTRDSPYSPMGASSFARYATGGAVLFAAVVWFQSYKLSQDMRRNTVCYSQTEVEDAVRRANAASDNKNNTTIATVATTDADLNLTGLPYDSMVDELDQYDSTEANGVPNELCAVVGGAAGQHGGVWQLWLGTTATATAWFLSVVFF